MSQGTRPKAVWRGLAATAAVIVLASVGWVWRERQIAREE